MDIRYDLHRRYARDDARLDRWANGKREVSTVVTAAVNAAVEAVVNMSSAANTALHATIADSADGDGRSKV